MYSLVFVWGRYIAPFVALLCYARLLGIPAEMYEAAGNRWIAKAPLPTPRHTKTQSMS